MGRIMGVLVDRTPKCHCEYAGEGIEYSWVLMKNYYHWILLDKKRSKEKFLESIRKSMSWENITKERVQKFSRCARRYILGYHVLRQMQLGIIVPVGNELLGQDSNSSFAIIPEKLEQMLKKFKMHL
jgi:hypothetical protein